jgi:hypothetical protein
MYKLIYYVPGRPYGTFASYSQMRLIAEEAVLSSKQISVVCVIDYRNKLIFKKCEYYDIHRELIDDLIFTPTWLPKLQ